MSKSVVINLGNGDLYRGCEQVTAQLWDNGHPLPEQFAGSLPPAPNLVELYQHWQLNYLSFYNCLNSRSRLVDDEIEVDEVGITNFSDVSFENLSQNLQASISNWLQSEGFLNIERKLRSALNPESEITVIMETNDNWLRRIPWFWWNFFEDYPKAEIALFQPEYKRIASSTQPNKIKHKVRILAVMGNSIGIDVEAERNYLQSLQDSEVKFLIKPNREEFNRFLWESQGWDVLFFAGHSQTENGQGKIYINENQTDNSLNLEQLAEALKAAIENGLKLAIFNSCDGLGLASVLEKLNIPTTIVMREPVPNLVAEVFFKFFLENFAKERKSLYISFQEARRQLQGLEHKFPAASCLPVIFQNPAVEPPNWFTLGGKALCPYRGLFAFSEEDADLFFGRERFTSDLVKAVKSKTFVAVVGASGSGKSSVVFAGLIPRLRQDKNVNWRIISFRPGNKPFQALANALLPLCLSIQDSSRILSHQFLQQNTTFDFENDRPLLEAELAALLQHDCQILQQIISDWIKENPNSRLVLIADQFEELYTQSPESEIPFFLDVLLVAVNLAPAFSLIITLRADFYGDALSYRPFSDALQGAVLNLGPMSEEELRRVITQPPTLMKVELEDGLVNRLIDDIWGEPGNLPLLEFALTQLWKKQLWGRLTHEAYSEIGGVEAALAEYAEQVYARLGEVEREKTKRIFIQLVVLNQGMQTTRRLGTRSQVNNWDLVTHLASTRLLVTNRDGITGEETVEIVHEALIKNWGRLEQWIQFDGEFRRWQEQLRAAIYQWERSGEDRGALLRGVPLNVAEDWLQQRSEELSTTEKDFIQRSQVLRDREIKNQHRRRRLTISGLSLGLIFALILAGFARWQWQNSLVNEIRAIAANSQGLLNSNNTLDALIEAIKAKRKLEQVVWVDSNTQDIVESTLTKAVHGAVEYNRLPGHKLLVNEIFFSPDGKIIASASLDKTVKLWNREGKLLKTLTGHTAAVIGLAFSPRSIATRQGYGQIIATASNDKTVKLWTTNGTEIRTLEGHTARVIGVDFSYDGKIIASASTDGKIKFWNTDGTLINTFRGHTATINKLVFSPVEKIIASASTDGTIKLWNTDGTLINTFKGHTAAVNGVAFSPDGKIIASASSDNTVKLWNTKDGSLLKNLEAHQDIANDVNFSFDGKIIASASVDNTIKIWNFKDGTLLQTIKGHNNRFFRISFAPNTDAAKNYENDQSLQENSKLIAAISGSNDIQIFKLDHPLQTIFRGHDSVVPTVAYSPDGKIIASGSYDKTIKLWKSDGTLLKNITGHKDQVLGVSFSPDGNQIASVSVDKTIKIWQVDGTLLNSLEGHKDQVWTVAYSPDGKKIASSGMDGTIKLWNIENINKPTLLKTINTHQDGILGLSFSPDGKKIASASPTGTNIKLWTIDGTLLNTFDKSHNIPVVRIAFSPDGKIIASASQDNTVKLWKTDGTLIHTFKGHKAGVWGIAFSPDGQKIASAAHDNTIKVWQKDGTLLRTLEAHQAGVWGVAFSPDGKKIVSSSEDKTLIVWNLERILSNDYLVHGCNWVRDYLTNNPDVSESEKGICDGVGN